MVPTRLGLLSPFSLDGELLPPFLPPRSSRLDMSYADPSKSESSTQLNSSSGS